MSRVCTAAESLSGPAAGLPPLLTFRFHTSLPGHAPQPPRMSPAFAVAQGLPRFAKAELG